MRRNIFDDWLQPGAYEVVRVSDVSIGRLFDVRRAVACLLGLCLIVRLLVAPSVVLLRLFGLVALSDVEGIVSLGLLYCYRNLI